MGQAHPSTPEQRAQWAAIMLAHQGRYGMVTQLSRDTGVSRPTLYAWRDQARQILCAAWRPPTPPVPLPTDLRRHVLTLWAEAHASDRGIQTCLRTLTARGVSLATIIQILHDAQQRALHWMQTHMPSSVRSLALDEIYANDHQRAYLNVVDVHSGAVWASEGLLEVDAESWTLVLWELQERGLHWARVVTDGGRAMHAACVTVTPHLALQRDVWHVLARCAQTEGRLARRVVALEARSAGIARQAARQAAGKALQGKRVAGRRLCADVTAHAAAIAQAQREVHALGWLTQEVRRLLDAVATDRRGVLTLAQRAADLDAALALLAEVAETLPPETASEVRRLHTSLQRALPDLLTFVPHRDQLQADLTTALSADGQALLAWAWQRRHALGWTSGDILLAIPDAWRPAARVLLSAWDEAVRVSSAVERWHSIMRPHLAVHRRMTTGMLALLAVWHNHRVFPRGIHKGQSPLHLSGMTDAPTDWLIALGYPPIAAVPPQATTPSLAA